MAERVTIITVPEEDRLEVKIPEGDPRAVRNTSGSVTSRIFGPVGNKVWPPGGEIAINEKGNLEMEVPKGIETIVRLILKDGKVIAKAIRTVDVEDILSEECECRWYEPTEERRSEKTDITRENWEEQRNLRSEGESLSGEKTYISHEALEELIEHQLRGKLTKDRTIAIADKKYYCPPLNDAVSIIEVSGVDCKKWARDGFDCDDFAHVLKACFIEAAYAKGDRRLAHCFGIVWMLTPDPDKSHALNWMVNDDLKLRFVEPQTGHVIDPQIGYAISPRIKEKLEIKDISLMLA
jgi:hypothetical protein